MTVLHYGQRGQTLARTLVADIASLVPNNKYSNINYLQFMGTGGPARYARRAVEIAGPPATALR
jgi:hypothetical protein